MPWLDRIRALPPDRISVLHDPPTERYDEAQLALPRLLHREPRLEFLGVKPGERERTLEIAVWAPHPMGRRRPGIYACLRIELDPRGEIERCVLFCFWNGRDDHTSDERKTVRTVTQARRIAADHGFREDPA